MSFSSFICFVLVHRQHQANVLFCNRFKWFHWPAISILQYNNGRAANLCHFVYLFINKRAKQPTNSSMSTDASMMSAERKKERLSTSKYANLLFQYMELNCNFSLSFTYSRRTQLPWPNNWGQHSNTASLQSTEFITSLRKHKNRNKEQF